METGKSMEENDEVVLRRRACEAMENKGITDHAAVLQVLDELLQAYEGDWTYIKDNDFAELFVRFIDRDQTAVATGECSTPVPKPSSGSPSDSKRKQIEHYLFPSSRKRITLDKNKAPSVFACQGREGKLKDSSGPAQDNKNKNTSKLKLGSGSASAGRAAGSLAGACSASGQLDTGESSFVGKKYPKHNPADITRGQESIPIPIVPAPDGDGDESLPENFIYSNKAIVYQHAKIDISLSKIAADSCCDCTMNSCLRRRAPCHCAGETGGLFAYNHDGCVTDKFLRGMERIEAGGGALYTCEGPCEMETAIGSTKPCQGHKEFSFIKECWVKCSCHKKLCGNRVVQNGIRYPLEVFWTPEGKGWGVRCTEDLPKGAFVCEYIGEILTNTELDIRNTERAKGEKHSYPVLLDSDYCTERSLNDDELLCLDCTNYGNVCRFINHRCADANLIFIPVEIEVPDRHFYHVALFTRRPVPAMQELTWDYTIDFDNKTHPIPAFTCKCGSPECRDKNRGRGRGRRGRPGRGKNMPVQ